MTTKSSKHHGNGAVLLEDSPLDERAPAIEPDGAGADENPIVERAPAIQPAEAAVEENKIDESASRTQQGTQQFVTFIAGDEVFAADIELRRKMAPVFKKHMAVDSTLDAEVRAQLRHVREGSRDWEIEYAKVMEQVKRRKGL